MHPYAGLLGLLFGAVLVELVAALLIYRFALSAEKASRAKRLKSVFFAWLVCGFVAIWGFGSAVAILVYLPPAALVAAVWCSLPVKEHGKRCARSTLRG